MPVLCLPFVFCLPTMTEPITLRPLTADDYPAFLDLMRAMPGVVVRDADAPEAVARYLARNPGLSFLACAGERPVGGLLAGHDGRRGYLNHLLVHPDFRGRGIARALVDRALAALGEAGIGKTHLDVLESNAAGQSFWTALGWQPRDDLRRYSCTHNGGANA